MKSISIVAAAVLASVAVAQPHGKHHHQHQAHHHKRDGPPVVWVTDYDIVTETVGYTTTIWVSEGFVPPEPSTPPTSSAPATQVPAQFFEPIPSPSSQPPAPSSSSSSAPIVVAPPPAAVSTPAQPTSVVAFVAPPVVQSSSSPAAVSTPEPVPVVVPTPEPVTVAPPAPTTPAYVAPVQSSTPVAALAAAPESSPSSGTPAGSTTADCSSESNACTGDITHYDTGMGACGWPNVSTDKVIALPFEFMGTQSNGNPFCGKTVTISLNGKTTTAEVVDKCMGCYGRSIDLSDGAFMDLADMDEGRVHDVVWWFN